MSRFGFLLLLIVGVIMALTVHAKGIVNRMAAAIQSFEGWYPGSRSERNNNPGNLKFANQAGAIGQDEQEHAIFDTYEHGWAALVHQIEIAFNGLSHVYSPSMTLYDFFARYAEANSTQYAESVAAQIGVSPSDTLAHIATGV